VLRAAATVVVGISRSVACCCHCRCWN